MSKKKKVQAPSAGASVAELSDPPPPADPAPGSARAGLADTEPTAQQGSIPIPLIGLLALMLFIGDIYLMNYGADIGGKGGSFPPKVYYPPFQNYAAVDAANPKSAAELLLAQGRQAFMATCAPCHQPTGLGNPAQNIPPLAGSEWVLTPGPGRAIRIVLNSVKGQITVKGQTFDNPAMPPWRSALTDDQIAAVLTHVRGNKEWGHNAAPVLPEAVKKIRDATADRAEPWTAQELSQVPETE